MQERVPRVEERVSALDKDVCFCVKRGCVYGCDPEFFCFMVQ